MGKQHDIDDAAKVLGVTTKTVRRWIAEQQLETTDDPEDKRKRLLTQAQVDALASRYRPVASVGSMLASDPADHALLLELRAEVARLKSRIVSLEGQISKSDVWDRLHTASTKETHSGPLNADVTSQEPTLRSRPSGTPRVRIRDNRRTTQTPDMPSDLLPMHEFAEAHGIHQNTARKQWSEKGVYQVTGPYKVGRSPKVWAIDRENAVKALRYWLHEADHKIEPSILGHCSLSGCPCGDLVPGEG